MNILITGVSGYLGSQLANNLAYHHTIAGTVRTSSDTGRISDQNCIHLINIDSNDWQTEVNDFSPDVVINTAALYGRKGESLTALLSANVSFPLAILECLSVNRTFAFINCGTSLPAEVSAYALTKYQFAQIARLECACRGVKFINARLEHFFGPNDDDTKFTSYVLNQCIAGNDLNLTEGTQYRDFIYIEDLISAFCVIIENLDSFGNGDDLDIGSGKAILIRDFVSTVHQVTQSRSRLVFGALPVRNNEPMYSCANTERLASLGWRPATNLRDAICAIADSKIRDHHSQSRAKLCP